MIRLMLIAGIGGFVGTCARYLIGRWVGALTDGSFPFGTFMANMAGCFVFGLAFGFLSRHQLLVGTENALLLVGFCGGFTTFSSFSNDMLSMLERGAWMSFAIYLAASIILGTALLFAGRELTR